MRFAFGGRETMGNVKELASSTEYKKTTKYIAEAIELLLPRLKKDFYYEDIDHPLSAEDKEKIISTTADHLIASIYDTMDAD